MSSRTGTGAGSARGSGREPPIRWSCSLMAWQRLQSLGRSVDTSSEKLQRYKSDLETPEAEHLLEAHRLAAEADNLRIQNDLRMTELDRLRRICARKRLNIAQMREQAEKKENHCNELKRRCELTDRFNSEVAVQIQRKHQHLSAFTALIRQRSKSLLSDLRDIFRIEFKDARRKECSCQRIDYICGVHLPPTNALKGHPEMEFTAALGYLVQLLDCISWLLDYRFRYPLVDGASTSQVAFPMEEKVMPLYGTRWKADRERLDQALTLLGKNIAQLRADSGLDWFQDFRYLQAVREWLEVAIHGKGDITFLERPWKCLGTPALLLDSLDEDRLHPTGTASEEEEEGQDEKDTVEKEPMDRNRLNGYSLSSLLEADDLDTSAISSLSFEDSKTAIQLLQQADDGDPTTGIS